MQDLFALDEKSTVGLLDGGIHCTGLGPALLLEAHDPSHPRYDARNSRKYGAVISDTYENLDRMLGRLLDNFDEDTLVIVMSDHGFGPVHTDLYVNRLLMQLNLLTPGPQNLRVLAQESVQRLTVRLLEKQPLRSFADSRIAHWIGRRLFGSGSLSVGAPYRRIDFEGTKAFFPSRSGQYIRINLKTREPSGIVEPGKPYEDCETTSSMSC